MARNPKWKRLTAKTCFPTYLRASERNCRAWRWLGRWYRANND